VFTQLGLTSFASSTEVFINPPCSLFVVVRPSRVIENQMLYGNKSELLDYNNQLK